MMTQTIVISGIQVDNAKNRAYAERLGTAGIPWPQPYKNSVVMTCADCEGDIWIGPILRAQSTRLVAAGVCFRLLCLLCAALETRNADTTIVQFSGKKEGE